MQHRRVSSNSPAPPDFGNHRASFVQDALSESIGSPKPSAPGTPQSLALPMYPPPTSHSRRSSFGSQAAPNVRRSVSPSPSAMPLPAVMPSASPSLLGAIGLSMRSNIYANETFTSFFRRLTFTPDGSLLFTPAGQHKTSNPAGPDGSKSTDDIINTVYIYTRGGLNKPPVAFLPGHKKPSIAVKCSPLYYNIRASNSDTKEITIDTGTEDDIAPLPEPAMHSKPLTSNFAMDPPPLTSAPSPSPSAATMVSPRNPVDAERSPSTPAPPASGPPPAFGLPYRIVYAVATQDAVYVYDTQQQRPLCIISNLHYATFTDLTWSSDGHTLLMTSSDGFCSVLTFAPGELGTVCPPPVTTGARHTPTPISAVKANSATSTPQATPTAAHPIPAQATALPAVLRQQTSQNRDSAGSNPPPSPFTTSAHPASPARSMSTSSVATEASFARAPDQNAPPAMNNPTPSLSSIPSIAAAGSAVPLFTPPQTPGHHVNGSMSSVSSTVSGVKRQSDTSETVVEEGRGKKRRIAPTPFSEPPIAFSAPPPPPSNSSTGGE